MTIVANCIRADIVAYNLPKHAFAHAIDVRITSPVPVRGEPLFNKQAALPLRAADRSATE